MKTLVLPLLLLSATCVSITYVRAQEATKPAGPSSIQSTKPQSVTPQPASEMRSLAKALPGKWSITEKFEAAHSANPDVARGTGKTSSNGGEGYGEEVWRSGPGGFTFMEEEHNHSPMGEFFLVGFMWWDSTTKSFRGMECTSGNPHGCDVESSLKGVSLKWDGKQLVVDMKFMENGKKMAWHEVFFDITPTSFTQTADMGEAGGPLKRWVTIHATKVAERTKEPVN